MADTPPPQLLPPSGKAGHDIRRILLMFVSVIWTGVILSIASEKWGQGFPLWAFILLCAIGVVPILYLVWTAEPINKCHRLIYSHPKMSLLILVLGGAVFGGGIGAWLWWVAYRQQPPASIQDQPATQAAPPAPTPQTTATPTPQPLRAEAAPSSSPQPANKPRTKRPNRKASPPNYTEDILLGRKKGPPANER